MRNYKASLKESLALQTKLRQLTHKVLAGQEDERKKISLFLQDEIAQTLLGINVRLLSLKIQSQHDAVDIKQKIKTTQKLLGKSALHDWLKQGAPKADTHLQSIL